jgi:hypothetical protein
MKLKFNADQLTKGQHKFLQSQARNVLLAGGYGSGKTTGLSLKILQLKTINKKTPGLIVAPTRPVLFSVTKRNLDKILRLGLSSRQMPTLIDPQGECYYDFGDSVPIFLRSATRPESIDGLDVGWACCDEIRYYSKMSYDTILGRIRTKCALPQMACASTPSIGYMSEEFNSGKANRELIVSGTKENAHNLAPGFIDNLRKSYSPRMQKAVIEGLFTILEGAVFEEFDPDANNSEWFVDYEPTKRHLDKHKVMLAVDPGYRRSAYLFIVEISPLEWIVFDQLMLDNKSDQDAVDIVNRRGYPIDEVWVDPAAGAKQSIAAIDIFTALRQIKPRVRHTRMLRAITKFRDINFGIDKLRVLLGGYEGQPIRLMFAKRLVKMEHHKPRGIVKDLASLRYPEVKDGRAIVDTPLKDGITDHSTDALRYWAVGRWMTEPALRNKDEMLKREKSLGYKAA